MFPCVYFFFPETRLRSLEEMDHIFKKSTNVFDAVSISIKEPHRYDAHGELKREYLEEAIHRENALVQPPDEKKASDSEGNTTTELKS